MKLIASCLIFGICVPISIGYKLSKDDPKPTINSNTQFDKDKVKWILYTYGKEPFEFDLNTDPQVLVDDHGFDVNKVTKFVAHGWLETGYTFTPPFAEGTIVNSYYLDNLNF